MTSVRAVIIAEELRGRGTESSPSRMVTVVYTIGGTKIAEHDPYLDSRLTAILEQAQRDNHLPLGLVRELLDLFTGRR